MGIKVYGYKGIPLIPLIPLRPQGVWIPQKIK